MRYFSLIFGLLLIGLSVVGSSVYAVEASSLAQAAQEGEAIYQQKCASCHTIGGGDLVGPDLEGVTGRRERSWLESFIADPNQLIDSGDPAALQLLADYNNLAMPALGLSDAQVSAVLAYLEAPSAGGPAADPLAGLPLGGAAAGQKLFYGQIPLQNGGVPCAACHTVSGNGLAQGGSLGPDLTNVIQRYGMAGLAANLNQIAFPTMQGPYLNHPLTPQEQGDLVTFFYWIDTEAAAPPPNPALLMLGAGFTGALVLFGILAVLRPRERMSLSARLRKRPARSRNIPAGQDSTPDW